MKTLVKLNICAVVLLAAATLLFAPAKSHAQEATDKPAETSQEQQAPKDTVYNYTAQPGDSYSKMARKAIQTLGLKKDIKLSAAQIIYAETSLTRAAGSPELNVGQAVTFKEADIEAIVKNAQNLTPTQESAWNYYVQFADFNTSSVGQAT